MNAETDGAGAGELKIESTVSDNVNIAFYQNAVPIVRELMIENTTDRDLSGLSGHLASEPPFLTPGVWRIDRIAAGATHHLRSLDSKLDPAFLAGVRASRRAQLRFRVDAEGQTLAEEFVELNMLPPSHWGGVGTAP